MNFTYIFIILLLLAAVSFSADTRSECYADCQEEYALAVANAEDMASQDLYTEHHTYGGTCPRVTTYGGSGPYANKAKCLAEFLICSEGASDCTPQLQVCCKEEAVLSASRTLDNCHDNCDYNYPDDEGDPTPGGYGDEVCPTSCINGKIYNMVYTGSGMCEVQDLTPIQTCPYGCVKDNPHAGCAEGAQEDDPCSDFYSRFSTESCYVSTHYYDCYCNPQNGEPICQLEDCQYGCDDAGVKCASAPSTPSPTVDCTQPGAVSTGTGCKSDSRCSNECPDSQFQLMYPACTCFSADFPDLDGAMVVGADVTLKTEGGQTSQNSRMFMSLGDTISTSSSPAMIVFPDGTYLKLNENTEVEMDIDGFFLKEGRCWVKVEKGKQTLYIKTQTLATGARGTAFEVWSTSTEDGARTIEGTAFAQFYDSSDEEYYEVTLPAGSEIIYDKLTDEIILFEGSGQTLTNEYNAFNSDASSMVSIYSSGTYDSAEGCCGPAFILLAALLFSSCRIKN